MPSRAASEFNKARARAALLIRAANVRTVRKSDYAAHRASCLHAALAMLVAAWEAYLERLVREVQSEIADPGHARLSAVLALLTRLTEGEVKRFNTPNANNARELLISHTGYDPINDWQWPKGGLPGVQTRTRLDEILRVRHSFAHGLPVPTDIGWVRDRRMPGILSSKVLTTVDRFIAHLVAATDAGMTAHLQSVYGLRPTWRR